MASQRKIMKKILLSLGMLVVVGAIVAGATIAFYNDTETSTGNIFVAGSVDIKVDHLAQTYNGVDCETCSVNVFSSETTQVTGGTGAYVPVGGYPVNAVELSFVHPAWLAEATLPPAQWIWVTNPVLSADTTNGAEYTFQKKFNWNGSVSGVTLDLALAADNGYKIVFNGTEVANALGTETNYGALVNTTAAEALMLPEIQNGVNTLEITVRNKAGNSNPASNPAGLIFDLTVQRPENECEADSAFQNACMLWTEQDLDGSQQFFNFGDIKPDDWGKNLISLHVTSNDAYICLIPDNVQDNENGVVDPELEANDTTDDGLTFGELSGEIEFFGWTDGGDGVYQNGEGILIPAGTPLEDIDTEMIEMSLSTTGTGYIGLAWCAGTQTVSGSTISCDGNGMSNIVQTDIAMADLVAYAVQQRNNENFDCESVLLPN